MLFAVRNWFPLIVVLVILLAVTASVATSSQQSTPPLAPPPAAAPQSAPQPAPAQPAYNGPVIVLDPAHGGTDSGARGENGIVEKDIVLQFARVARAELVRQGYKVVLSRDDDSNPSYDDRAAAANAYRDAIFVSLHVSSTGTAGTARAYYYQFWKPLPPAPASQDASNGASAAPAPVALASPPSPSTTLVPWNEAQRPFSDASQRLADQLQTQMASAFSGSPGASAGVEMRGLRSVAAPAVAIEISSVAVKDPKSLTVFAGPLADALTKAIQAFHPLDAAGMK
jgi:N-acetylmuramoyl-L-alanine amidase